MNTPKVGRSKAAKAEKVTRNNFAELRLICEKLLGTVESTGGLIEFSDGTYAPEADSDWIDLGDIVLKARDALQNITGKPVTLTIKTSGY